MATRAALPRTGYTPDDIANIIHNQGTSRWGPRVTPTGRPQEAFSIGREEARQDIPRRAGWASVLEGHEDHGIAAWVL